MSIKCLVIDDERLAREYLKNYIAKLPQLKLLGEFNSPLKAMELIRSGEVDLIFLDIQMPDITGVEFMRSLPHAPEVVFTTAYQEYALEGYELNAADYLLKPFSFNRFFQAVNRVAEKLKNKTFTDASQTTFEEEYLTVRADRKFYKINFEDLIYIEGQKAYVTFHTEKRRITALVSLKELESSLPPKRFVRIHKSYIVAIKKIASLEGHVLEVGGVKLPVGKTYRERVLKMFG